MNLEKKSVYFRKKRFGQVRKKLSDDFSCRAEDDIEYCVLCGNDTGYLKNVPIWKRDFYIEGGGQLCGKCFRECMKG